jgi:hypothetical protein
MLDTKGRYGENLCPLRAVKGLIGYDRNLFFALLTFSTQTRPKFTLIANDCSLKTIARYLPGHVCPPCYYHT